MAETYKQRVGARIREAREAKGWTQAQLARELPRGIEGASISRWETGKVLPETYLDALAGALDVDVSYFMVEPAATDGELPAASLAEIQATLEQGFAALRAEMEALRQRLPPESEPPPGGSSREADDPPKAA